MPVIGRLDEQVDRLLIAPVRRRDQPAEAASAETIPPAADRERAEAEASARRRDERPPARRDEAPEELPVWLL